MTESVTSSQLRGALSHYLGIAQEEPVEIMGRDGHRRAVVVSPDFYDKAVSALQDRADVLAASAARAETGSVTHEALIANLKL